MLLLLLLLLLLLSVLSHSLLISVHIPSIILLSFATAAATISDKDNIIIVSDDNDDNDIAILFFVSLYVISSIYFQCYFCCCWCRCVTPVVVLFFCLVSEPVRDMKLTMRKQERINLNLHLSKSPHHILDFCILDHPPLWTIIFFKLYPMGCILLSPELSSGWSPCTPYHLPE